MRRYFVSLWLLPLLALACGCAAWRSNAPLDYRTIQADPHHDSDRAKLENQRAIKLMEKEKFDKAEQVLQRSLIADVTYGPAHNNLGNVYFSQGKYYLAAWEFEYACKLMPHRPECQNNLGLVYEAVGKLDEAISSYSLAYGMDDKNPVVIGNLARARIRRGDDDPAVRQLLADLRLYDTRPEWIQWANERSALGPRSADAGFAAPLLPKAEDGNLPLSDPESVDAETIPLPYLDQEDDLPLPSFGVADPNVKATPARDSLLNDE